MSGYFVIDCPNCGEQDLELEDTLDGMATLIYHDCGTKFLVKCTIIEDGVIQNDTSVL